MNYSKILSKKSENLNDLALSLKSHYSLADPFPHIQIDNFFSNEYLETVLQEFPDLSKLTDQYTNRDYILIFPFCSKKHQNKKWPYFKDLISKIRREYKNNYSVLIAPGPGEFEEANQLNAKVVMYNGESISIKMLISLIYDAKFIIANDTGPAHIASHLKKKGLVLFGSHTSAKKVSIENSNFRAITVKNLADLNVDTVMEEVKIKLN